MIRVLALEHLGKVRDATAGPEGSIYDRWLTQFDELSAPDVSAIRAHISAASLQAPLIVVRVARQTEAYLARTLSSLDAQLFEDWRALLCFEPECSEHQFARAQIRASADPRLTVWRISTRAAASLVSEQPSTFLLLSAGIALRRHAIYMFAVAATTSPASIIYSDEDRLGKRGERFAPSFKPAFSPELFRQRNYLGSCIFLQTGRAVPGSVIRDLLTQSHSVDSLIDEIVPSLGAADVLHIPHILFHTVKAMHARPPLPTAAAASGPLPSVSIIIPTKDKVELLRACLESIRQRTEYPSDKVEIIIVDHESQEPESISFFRETAAAHEARLLNYAGGFNYSKINNTAAAQCQADILVFLNNDTVIVDPLWLRRLVGFAGSRDVGAVGGKLLYPDGTVQHGGVVVGIQCSAVHCHVGLPNEDGGLNGLANITREVGSTTAACMAMRREVFEELGGLDERFATAFNDTDLCLRALERGYRNIYIGHALAIHHECKTRGRDDTPEKVATFQSEAELVRSRHRKYFKCDPYYNPNLSAERLYELAFPPRRRKPWREHVLRKGRLRVLLLSRSHGRDHPLSRIMDLQARRLVAAGHHVCVGGPKGDAELEYGGCVRIEMALPEEAAVSAFEHDIDCIVAHDPGFFSVAKWTGPWPKVICCQHGELPREMFRDERDRLEAENRVAFSLADCVIKDRVNGASSFTFEELETCAQNLNAAIEKLCLAPTADSVSCAGTHAPKDSTHRDTGVLREANGAGYVLDEADRRGFYAALGALNGSELVDQAYLAILGRYADHTGRLHYCDQLSRGVSRARIVWEIATSEEARSRSVRASDVMAAAGLRYVEDAVNHKPRLANLLTKIWPR